MALSNRDRIGKALDELRNGLLPFISDHLNENLGSSWEKDLPANFCQRPVSMNRVMRTR